MTSDLLLLIDDILFTDWLVKFTDLVWLLWQLCNAFPRYFHTIKFGKYQHCKQQLSCFSQQRIFKDSPNFCFLLEIENLVESFIMPKLHNLIFWWLWKCLSWCRRRPHTHNHTLTQSKDFCSQVENVASLLPPNKMNFDGHHKIFAHCY